MKALILNSGLGHRMGVLTSEHPKCMTDISSSETILSRQLRLLYECGISEVIMTTGYFDEVLIQYSQSVAPYLHFSFVKNPIFAETNYIYSIYCAKELLKNQDIILMHGDLIFEKSVLEDAIAFPGSCMKVSSTMPLPEKDFKSVVHNGRVEKVGIEFFEDAMESQALYKLAATQWNKWLSKICEYCENGKRKCYAEVALNEISDDCCIWAMDVKDRLCAEIDNPEDLAIVTERLRRLNHD